MLAFDVSIIKGKTAYDLVHRSTGDCIRIVKDAYLAHGEGRTVNPDSYFLRFPDNPGARIIALPAFLGRESNVAGIKWIASFPENVAQGFPRASAALILNDASTGYPFAILESSVISAARTAASAVLAAEWLHGRDEKVIPSLGIVGTGLIARYVYRFLMATGWRVDQVLLFDATAGQAATFRASVVEAGAHASVSDSPDLPSLVRASSTIVLTTTAGVPHIHDTALFAHNPLVLHLSLRDLAPAILLASHNVVDDVEHVMKANTSPHLVEQQTGSRAFVTGTLAQIMTGAARVDGTKPVVFSPFGLGVLDLAVGKWVYDEARANGQDVRLTDFFYDMDR